MIVTSVEGNESNLLLTLRREQSVSILPSKIMMIPTADKDKGISIGRSILKIRSRSPGEEVTIRRLTCETSDGEDLDVSFNRLTNETFRVEVRIKDVEKASVRRTIEVDACCWKRRDIHAFHNSFQWLIE